MVQDGDVVGDSAGDGLVVSPPPPVPEHAPRRATRPSNRDKLMTFVFITPLSPFAARAMICSLITIPHLLTLSYRSAICSQILQLIHICAEKHKRAFHLTCGINSNFGTCSLGEINSISPLCKHLRKLVSPSKSCIFNEVSATKRKAIKIYCLLMVP